MGDLIERLDAEIARKRDREGDMLFLAPPDPLLTETRAALASLQADLAEHVAHAQKMRHINGRMASEITALAERYRAAQAQLVEMRSALQGITGLYVGLVESGDAGFWNPEAEPEVQAARAALSHKEDAA